MSATVEDAMGQGALIFGSLLLTSEGISSVLAPNTYVFGQAITVVMVLIFVVAVIQLIGDPGNITKKPAFWSVVWSVAVALAMWGLAAFAG